MEDFYMLSDAVILCRMGEKLKRIRLKQNITQKNLAKEAGVSLSTVKKIEKGEIRSVDALLRILRMLGKLDVLLPLLEEEQLSPSEYYELMQGAGMHQRKRAASKDVKNNNPKNKEEN